MYHQIIKTITPIKSMNILKKLLGSLGMLLLCTTFSQAKVMVNFKTYNSDSCQKSEINFASIITGLASGDTVKTVEWTFTGGSPSTATGDTVRAQVFLKPTSGSNITKVKVKVTTTKGDVDSFERNFTIKPSPVVKFGITNRCYDSAITFTDSSDIIGSPSATYSYHVYSTTGGSYSKRFTGRTQPDLLLQPDYYESRLRVVVSSNGCADSNVFPFTVFDKPKAKFTGDTIVCQRNIVSFTDATIPDFGPTPDSFIWVFGDGNTTIRTKDTVTHAYQNAGNFTVKETVYTINGCTGFTQKTVVVNPTPVPDFVFGKACQGSLVSFTDKSTISSGSISYLYNFGTGVPADTDVTASPKFAFLNNGAFRVSLKASSIKGCSDTVSKVINVTKTVPVKIQITDACTKDSVIIKDVSSPNISDTVVKRFFYFGDGQSDSNVNITSEYHVYAGAGKYPVQVKVRTQSGCYISGFDTAQVFPRPTPDFSYTTACANTPTYFTDLSKISTPDSIQSVIWDFADLLATPSNPNVSTSRTPVHTYTTAGTYKVTLRATSYKGCDSVTSKTITVLSGPTNNFTNTSGCENTAITFTYTGNATNFKFDFGDTTTTKDTSSTSKPVYTYSYGGAVNIRLVSVSTNGCRDTLLRAISIYRKAKADFTYSGTCQSTPTNFKNNSDSGDLTAPTISKFAWNFNGVKVSGGSNYDQLDHQFDTAGVKSVTLTTTTDFGCVSSATKAVTINPKPTGDFTYVKNSCREDGVQLINQSSSNVKQFSYDFGDGSDYDSTSSPSHLFKVNKDSEMVTLTVVSNKGCTDTAIKFVKYNKSPQASIVYNPGDEIVCLGTAVVLNDGSLDGDNNPTFKRLYLFGDGSSDTNKTANKIYPAAGKYNIRLVSYSSAGCKDTTPVIKSQVLAPPLAVISYDSILCQATDVNFYGDSSVNASYDGYKWYFDGDPTFVTGIKVVQQFATSGDHSVLLVATNNATVVNGGCTDTDRVTINIKPTPVPSFTAKDACVGNASIFTNNTTIAAPGVLDSVVYHWSFGDPLGGTSDTVNPIYTYFDAGDYTVKLEAVAKYGGFQCAATVDFTSTVHVRYLPQPQFTITTTTGSNVLDNLDPSATFTDNTSSGSGKIIRSVFDYGDSTMDSNIAVTNHRFPLEPYDTGSYIVRLITTNQYGCTDTASDTVIVKQFLIPYFPNAFTPNSDDLNDKWAPIAKGVNTWHCTIMDRWGEIVYTSDDFKTMGWNGTYRDTGKRLPDGVYIYSIEATDYDNLEIKKYKGNIYLLQ